MRKVLIVAGAAWLIPVTFASAQTSIPGLENFTLERPQPGPTATPAAPPTSAPSPTATAASARTAAPIATPTGRPPRATVIAPVITPSPTIPAEPVPATSSPPPATAAPPRTPPGAAPAPLRWPIWLVPAGLLLAGLGAFLWWRRRSAGGAIGKDEPVPIAGEIEAAPPVPASDPVAPPPAGIVTSAPTTGGLVTSVLKPAVALSLIPVRGGVDTLRATLEFQLQLVNTGRGAARAVVVEAWLTSAGHHTEAELTGLFSGAVGEPMLPPFDLPAGAAIDLTGQLTTPRDALAVITAGERRSFVPVLAVRVGFADSRGLPTVTTSAFLVGISRDGQERLAPLPLDRGSRLFERLTARRYDG